MTYSPYIPLSGLSLGEASFVLNKERVTSSYIDFVLKVHGEKWQNIDVAFEYRFSDNDQWRTDAYIIGSQSIYIQSNQLLGLQSANNGYDNKFRWKYSTNNITEEW